MHALIYDSYARCSLRAAAILGGSFAHVEQNIPPNYLGEESMLLEIASSPNNSPPPIQW